MKKAIYTLFLASLVVSCTENMEDKAVREAKEYTEKYCPTPYVNDSRTDSAVFDKNTRVFSYYMTLRNKAALSRMPSRRVSIPFWSSSRLRKRDDSANSM